MKFDRLPTRRQPVRKKLFARLFNTVKLKRQRAAATATAEEHPESGINISRSLTIIFVIHILAIAMIFIHKQYLSERTPTPVANASTPAKDPAPIPNNSYPKLSSGDSPYMVRQGDNYSIIATKHNVDESALRTLNRGADIRAGVVLRIPKGQRIIAEEAPEVAALRNQPIPSDSEQGLVEISPQPQSRPAQLICTPEPAAAAAAEVIPRATIVALGRSHTLQPGENIWRVANKYKVSQKTLMALNNIKDPTKLKIGQILKIP